MSKKGAPADIELAEIAGKQHGVVTSKQLAAAGVSNSAASRRTRTGRLHRVHQGVYSLGYRELSQEGRWMAAVLTVGERAVLSHMSAAGLWGLLQPRQGPVHVSIPSRTGRRAREGIRIHRPVDLSLKSISQRKGIPVTTPARTIDDIHRIVSAAELRRAIRQAEVLGLRIEPEEPSERTRSELEHLFLRLCERQGLPPPEVNVQIGSRFVDFLWREQRVVVETDGYRYHRGSQAFEDDHDRDLDLRTLGYDIVRLTYRQVTTSPERAASAVADALQSRPKAIQRACE
jgi:very-short-patch-repair endonuclease